MSELCLALLSLKPLGRSRGRGGREITLRVDAQASITPPSLHSEVQLVAGFLKGVRSRALRLTRELRFPAAGDPQKPPFDQWLNLTS